MTFKVSRLVPPQPNEDGKGQKQCARGGQRTRFTPDDVACNLLSSLDLYFGEVGVADRVSTTRSISIILSPALGLLGANVLAGQSR